MDENRRLNRWQIRRKVKVKLHGAHAYTAAYVKDINLRGVQLTLDFKLPTDTFQKFNIALSEGIALDVEAWVAWQRLINGFNTYGLYFTKIKDADKEKIYRFLRNDFSEQLDQNWRGEIKEKDNPVTAKNSDDNRTFERFRTGFPVRFMATEKNYEGLARATDISAKGLCLTTNKGFNPHTSLELWLDIPDKSQPLYTRGEVMWSKEAHKDEYHSGVNLHKADFMGLARVLRVK